MADSANIQDPNQAMRVELILQQLETLPTLSTLALKLLEVTTSETSDVNDVVEIVSADPALSSKVLKLCRGSERGLGMRVASIDRAVKMLGFDALRNAVLTVQIFEMFEGVERPGGETASERSCFEPLVFWQHSLGVAVASQLLVEAVPSLARSIDRSGVFLGGLLHDLGQLALHMVMPKSFDKVCQIAETHGVSIDHACERIIGLDTHTAGKRLAEHWQLPHSVGDVMWLHGQPFRNLPDLPHRMMIGVISLADALIRRQQITTVGHGPRGEDLAVMGAELGIELGVVERLMPQLHEHVATRAEALGVNRQQSLSVLLRSISRANEALGRLNSVLQQRAVLAERQSRSLRAVARFHEAAAPGASVTHVLGGVVRSFSGLYGGSFFAVLYQQNVNDPWQLFQYAPDGQLLRSQLIAPPPGSTAVPDLADETQLSMQVMAMLPWLSDYLGDAEDLRDVRLLPLRCGWGVSAVMLHECEIDGRSEREQLDALSRTWAAAIAAAAQHQGAKRLGERLAQTNRLLTEMKDSLARTEAMAALGEIAAGAAHEMNNPLTVISGRSQLLAANLKDPHHKLMAEQIVQQSHRLSDMITSLRSFAEPVHPHYQPSDLGRLLAGVVSEVRKQKAGRDAKVQIDIKLPDVLPPVWADPELLSRAVAELIRNAMESEGSQQIELRVQIDDLDDRLTIRVTDDGSGLNDYALQHAFDPFFSAKPAGRQPGLGLARARRIVEAHDGQVLLENRTGAPGRGAIATIILEHWRSDPGDVRSVVGQVDPNSQSHPSGELRRGAA
jgi:signal transduction histidine kinase/HD-like signal output (HDOD) protein